MEAVGHKSGIRQEALRRRRALSPEARVRYSQAIADHLLHAVPPFAAARCIGLYAASPDEVQTSALAIHLLAAGKKLCFPRVVDPAHRTMAYAAVTAWEELLPGFASIPEPPASAPVVEADTIECLCLPGVAFDLAGHRVGRGAGYYDRWLRTYHGCRIGLAFECQIYPILPPEKHDQRVEWIVTEQRAIACQTTAHARV